MKSKKRKKANLMVFRAEITGSIEVNTKSVKQELPLEELLTEGSVAHFLNISSTSVRRLINAGSIPIIKIGQQLRIHPADVREFMAGSRLAGA